MKIRLWFIREDEDARLYSKVPPQMARVLIWIPRSIVEHTSKDPDGTHVLTLPDWWAERNGL